VKYLTGFVRPSVRFSQMNYVEYLSAVKFIYTIRLYQFRSTDYQAMLNVVQSVCKKSISSYRKTHFSKHGQLKVEE